MPDGEKKDGEAAAAKTVRWATRADAALTLALGLIVAASMAVILYRNHHAGDVTVLRGQSAECRIDVNRAEAAELMLLPNVGRARAEKILAWRRENGSLKTIDDLRRASGLSAEQAEALRDVVDFGKTAEKENTDT